VGWRGRRQPAGANGHPQRRRQPNVDRPERQWQVWHNRPGVHQQPLGLRPGGHPRRCQRDNSSGTYRIRIQYEEGYGANTFTLVVAEVQFEVFTGADVATAGLNGSYVNQDLRGYATQDDWRSSQTISGRRIDVFPGFTKENWGNRAAVGLTGGTDENWDYFSVQWDGFLRLYQPMRFATISDDGSRMWIDLNGNRRFDPRGSEFINNHWGQGQSLTTGPVSTSVAAGTHQVRLQYEEGVGDNRVVLVGVPAE